MTSKVQEPSAFHSESSKQVPRSWITSTRLQAEISKLAWPRRSHPARSMCVYNVLAYFYADYFDAGTPASSTVDVNSRFSRLQFSAFWSNGLASSVFNFAPILLRFFFVVVVFVYARTKIGCYKFFNFDLRKSYASSKPTG